MLLSQFPDADLLKIKTGYRIYPDISDRTFWENAKENAGDFFEKAHETLSQYPRKPLTASLYRQYRTTGNRSNFEMVYFHRRNELVIKVFLECFYNDGRYLDDILDLVWMVLEETTWVLPAHAKPQNPADSLPDFDRPGIDLFAAETGSILTFIYQTIGEKLDSLSPVVTRRIKARLTSDILDHYLERDDYTWMAFREHALPNNWNVWINSNILAVATILCEEEEKLRSIVHKVMRSINKYVSTYPEDGACDEGPNYWAVSVLPTLDIFELLHKITDGQVSFLDTEKSRNALDYYMKLYTGNGQCVNFSDSGIHAFSYYASIYKHGCLTKNETAKLFAKQLYEENPFMNSERLTQRMFSISFSKAIRMFDVAAFSGALKEMPKEQADISPDYYLESIQVMIAKSDEDPQRGLFLAAKGGHNRERHNHNDVGQFIVYKNGTKFLVDSGNMVYTAATFGEQRYELMSTRSGYHNLPLIDGKEQLFGIEYAAKNTTFCADGKKTVFSLDIKDAYENRDDIVKWVRTLEYDKPSQKILVTEDFAFTKECEYELHFLTPQKVKEAENGLLFTAENGETLHMDFPLADFSFQVETIDHQDDLLRSSWGDTLYRVILKTSSKQDKISYLLY